MSQLRRTGYLVVLLALAMVLAACGGDGAEPEDTEAPEDSPTTDVSEPAEGGDVTTTTGESTELTPVKFALVFPPNWVQAYFFSALDLGYYEEAGLDVEFLVPDATTTSNKLVALGRANLGETFGSDPAVARSQGLGLEIINVFMPDSLLGMMTIPGEIDEFAEIEGGSVGLLNTPLDRACFRLLLADAGLTEDDVEIVDPGFQLVAPLLAGELDMTTGAQFAEYITASTEYGEDLNFFPYGDVCPGYPQAIMVNSVWADENPDLVRGFNEATLRGLVYMIEQPEQSYELFIERFPDQEDDITLTKMGFMPDGVCAVEDEAGNGLGWTSEDYWQTIIDLLVEDGAIEESYPASELWTDEFLPDEPVHSSACGTG